MINNLQTTIERVKNHRLTVWAPIIASLSFLVMTLFVGVMVALQQSTDFRRLADTTPRNVELVFVPSSTPLTTDTLSTLFIRLDTHGEQIDGVQVVFDMKTEVTQDVTLRVKEPAGLRKAWEKVEGIDGGKRISFALITTSPGSPFSNGNPADVAEIIFTATKTGPVDLVFDDGWTKANKHKQYVNVLKHYVALQYQVAQAPSPTPKASASTGTSGTKGGTSGGGTSGTTTGTKGTTGTSSKTTTATVTVTTGVGGTGSTTGSGVGTASPSPTPALDLAMCNKSCTYSSQCGEGFLCYRGQCRRKGNVTSSTCAKVDDTGSLACNATCTSSSECKNGLACYQSKCRNSSNPESTSCAGVTLDADEAIAQLCNTECTTNAECGDALSCYRGTCRLATNPSSTVCRADETGGSTDASPSPMASVSPSPSPAAQGGGSSWLGTVFRWILVLGAIVGVIIAGVMGYLWYQDQRTAGL